MATWLKHFFFKKNHKGTFWKKEWNQSEVLLMNAILQVSRNQVFIFDLEKKKKKKENGFRLGVDCSEQVCFDLERKSLYIKSNDSFYMFEFLENVDVVDLEKVLGVSIGYVNEADFIGKDEPMDFECKAAQALSHIYQPDQILFVSAGDLYEENNIRDKAIGFVIARLEPYSACLDIIRSHEVVMRVGLSKSFYYKVDKKLQCVEWVMVVEDHPQHWKAFLLEDLAPLESLLPKLLYESEQQELIEISELEWPDPEDSSSDTEYSSDENSFEKAAEEYINAEVTDSVQSLNCSQVYVGSMDNISVFSQNDSSVKLLSNIPIVNTFDGNSSFRPSQLLAKNQSLLMVNELNPTCVCTMDLNKGRLKSSHKVSENAIKAVSHAGLSESNDFTVLTQNEIFSIDPRCANYIVQEYSYSKNPKLSSLSTTSSGYLAIGNAKGEIRLFTRVGQKAKTCFPGLGHQVTSIDLTKDATWLVATCDTYLIVLPTSAYGVNGFQKSITKKRRKARQLQLAPADIVKFDLKTVKFTPARFNLGSNTEEKLIITSTAHLMVIWNFKSVKQGKVYNYKIRPLNAKIVKNEFLNGKDEAIVTYSKGIEVQAKCKAYV